MSLCFAQSWPPLTSTSREHGVWFDWNGALHGSLCSWNEWLPPLVSCSDWRTFQSPKTLLFVWPNCTSGDWFWLCRTPEPIGTLWWATRDTWTSSLWYTTQDPLFPCKRAKIEVTSTNNLNLYSLASFSQSIVRFREHKFGVAKHDQSVGTRVCLLLVANCCSGWSTRCCGMDMPNHCQHAEACHRADPMIEHHIEETHYLWRCYRLDILKLMPNDWNWQCLYIGIIQRKPFKFVSHVGMGRDSKSNGTHHRVQQ